MSSWRESNWDPTVSEIVIRELAPARGAGLLSIGQLAAVQPLSELLKISGLGGLTKS